MLLATLEVWQFAIGLVGLAITILTALAAAAHRHGKQTAGVRSQIELVSAHLGGRIDVLARDVQSLAQSVERVTNKHDAHSSECDQERRVLCTRVEALEQAERERRAQASTSKRGA